MIKGTYKANYNGQLNLKFELDFESLLRIIIIFSKLAIPS